MRPFVPFAPIQCAAMGFWMGTAPLLEEKRNVATDAVVSNIANPAFLHGPCSWSRLSPNDHPANPIQWQLIDGPDQWLDGQEPDWHRRILQMANSRYLGSVFYRHSKPDVRWSSICTVPPLHVAVHPGAALGEDLKAVPMRSFHCFKDSIDEWKRYLLVKEIAHRVYEDQPRTPPPERLLEPLGAQRQIETSRK